MLFFKNLFTLMPNASKLYKQMKFIKGSIVYVTYYELQEQGENIFEKPMLKAHYIDAVKTLTQAIDMLDDLENLVAML